MLVALALAAVVVSCTGAKDPAGDNGRSGAGRATPAPSGSESVSGPETSGSRERSVLPDRLAGYKVENPAGKTGGAPAELPDQVGGTAEVRWVTSEKDPAVRVVLTAVELRAGSGSGTALEESFGGSKKTVAGQEVIGTSDGDQTYLLWRRDATSYVVASAPGDGKGIEDVLAATIKAATG